MSSSAKFTQHTSKPRFRSGQKVKVDSNHPVFGNISSDGTIIEVSGKKALVHVESIKADISVLVCDIHLK